MWSQGREALLARVEARRKEAIARWAGRSLGGLQLVDDFGVLEIAWHAVPHAIAASRMYLIALEMGDSPRQHNML